MFEKVKNKIEYTIKNKNIPYIDVSVYRDHKPIFRYFVGDGVTGKERLYMFSCTKPITVICTMQLVEQNKIKLSDSVEKYLPEYAELKYNGQKQTVTIEHLLTMTAGLTYDTTYYPIKQALSINNGKTDTEKVVNCFASVPLLFPAGERFNYSLCHDVLVRVVEVVAEKSFSDYVKENVFMPLGMSNSYFAKSTDDLVASMFGVFDDGIVKQIDKSNELIFSDTYLSGGAGIVSTVEDFSAFTDALACGGETFNGNRIIKEQTLRQITSLKTASLSVSNNFTCVQGNDYGYGLGLRVRQKDTEWGLPKGEFGWDGAAGSYLMADPVNKISVFIGMHLRFWPINFTGEHLNIVKEIYQEIK